MARRRMAQKYIKAIIASMEERGFKCLSETEYDLQYHHFHVQTPKGNVWIHVHNRELFCGDTGLDILERLDLLK